MNKKEVTILVVEDDEIDIDLMTRAFHRAKIGNPMVFARDGEEALEHLRGKDGARPIVERPYVVLTDLNMPRMNGLELLSELREDPDLANSIVFVLTTSDADQDRWRAYSQNVAGYILKDNVGDGFLRLIGMLDHYWKIVEFPTEKG